MSCNFTNNSACGCQSNIGVHGLCDPDTIILDGRDYTQLNWNEISVPEILKVPTLKPNIEDLDDVFVNAKIRCAKLIETPFAYQVYDRLALQTEKDALAAVLAEVATISLTAVIDAVQAMIIIIDPILFPALMPLVNAINAALAAVEAALASLNTLVTDVLADLLAPCLTAEGLVALANSVISAILTLNAALVALLKAATDLINATAGIPIIGPLVQQAGTLLLEAVQDVMDELAAIIAQIEGVIAVVGTTQILTLIQNEEGTQLTGRKIVIEGVLEQKVVYTALVDRQSVHSFTSEVPFSAYIIPYEKFKGLVYVQDVTVLVGVENGVCITETVSGYAFNPSIPLEVDLCEEFDVSLCVEDIFAYAMDERTVFKNITIFLKAAPAINPCA